MPQRPAAEILVFVNGAPDLRYKCLTAHWSAGGARLDHATLFYDFSVDNENLVGFRVGQPPLEIEIAVLPFSGSTAGKPYVIHWGKTSITALRLGDDEQKKLLTSRAEPFHFGGVLSGMYAYDPLSGKVRSVQDDLVFNPKIDGRALPNCAPDLYQVTGPATYVFLDPESARTPAAQALSGEPVFWTLASAVHHLCWVLNASEQHFENPDIFTLEADLGTDPDLVVDLTIKRGLSLPEALDRLLEPFGFGWHVRYFGIGSRSIAIFQRGVGQPVGVSQQNPDITKNDAADLSVDYNVGNTRNFVEVQGDHVYIESTWELSRAWPENQDTLNTNFDLAKDSDNYQNNPSYQRVWRDWVLNEAGDYTGSRPEITAAKDLTPVYAAATGDALGRVIPKRRKFLPCITQGADLAPVGEIHGTVVEWYDGTDWKLVDRLSDSTCHVLERECGVRFDGQHVPIELYNAGASAKVRITATIKFDQRITADIVNDATSPQSDFAPILVDAAEKFHFKQVGSDSEYYSDVIAGISKADQADDRQALADFAQELHDAWDMADVSSEIEIQGLDAIGPLYQLSQVVTGVLQPLEIDFNAKSAAATDFKYPQITAIEFFCEGEEQKRILHLETYRDESPV